MKIFHEKLERDNGSDKESPDIQWIWSSMYFLQARRSHNLGGGGTTILKEENPMYSAGGMLVIYRLVETFFHGQFRSRFSCHRPISLV